MTNDLHKVSEHINLNELSSAVWKGKWVILAIISVFTFSSVIYALSLPDVYKSEALLAPVSDNAGLKIPGQLGGLAALAGVNLSGMGGGDKTELALEIIKSREFLSRFIEKHDLYIPIMAANGWNRYENNLLIDPEIYDVNAKKWVRKVEEPFKPKPSLLEVHKELLNLLSISQDKASGMIKIGFEHYSPYLAKKIVDELIKSINDEMRQRDLVDAERSISYLNKQIDQTALSDVKVMLFSLIEEQTKIIMLANVREEYVVKTIDSAVIAEQKIKPKRAIIVILSIMFGLMGSIMYVWVRSRS